MLSLEGERTDVAIRGLVGAIHLAGHAARVVEDFLSPGEIPLRKADLKPKEAVGYSSHVSRLFSVGTGSSSPTTDAL